MAKDQVVSFFFFTYSRRQYFIDKIVTLYKQSIVISSLSLYIYGVPLHRGTYWLAYALSAHFT